MGGSSWSFLVWVVSKCALKFWNNFGTHTPKCGGIERYKML